MIQIHCVQGGTKLTSTRVTVGGLNYKLCAVSFLDLFSTQVRGTVLDVSAITDRLCFATIQSEEFEPSSAAATAQEHQIEVILKLRDGFLS